MSQWYEPKKKDISFSADEEEIHAYLFSDESGAVYASLKTKDVLELLVEKGYQHGKDSR